MRKSRIDVKKRRIKKNESRAELHNRCRRYAKNIAIRKWNAERSLFRKKRIERKDVIQEANLAVQIAAKDFNPEKGTRFDNYATLKVTNALNEMVRKTELAEKNVKWLPADFLARVMHVDKKTVLEKVLDKERQKLPKKIAEIILKLDTSQINKNLLIDRFGLHGGKAMTYRQLARKYKISHKICENYSNDYCKAC